MVDHDARERAPARRPRACWSGAGQSVDSEVERVAEPRLAGDGALSGGYKPGLLEHPRRGAFPSRPLRRERPQPLLVSREPTELAQASGRHTAVCNLLRDPVADL